MSNLNNTFPIGIDNFRELIACRDEVSKKALFIDKSLIIRDLLRSNTKITLLTRPRRFGKTLVLSMLEHFFAAEVNGEATAGMFDELKIAAYPEHMKHQGQYPVIFITFKDAKGDSFDEVFHEIKAQLINIYQQNRYLLESDKLAPEEKKFFSRLIADELNHLEIRGALLQLSSFMHAHHKKKVIILIDEYDSPIHSAYNNNYYSACINFMRPFLSKALKHNKALHLGAVTGILRVAKESIFSGINNFKVYSVLSDMYSEYFGFTESEVNYLIDQLLPTVIDRKAIKNTYNGYNFGGEVIYNPWSIINCLNDGGVIDNYWINTADNTLIKRLVINSNEGVRESINQLIQGKQVREMINENLVFDEIEDSSVSVFMFLLMAGYLTASNVKYDLPNPATGDFKIPNLEVLNFYYEIVQGWLRNLNKKDAYNKALYQLLLGDVDSFAIKLKETTQNIVSYFDVGSNSQEKFYHGMILGIAAGITNTHEVRSNRESGFGRYDLMIIPKDIKQYQLGVVMEFKFVKNEAQIEEAAQQALTQIESQNYTQELETRGIKHIIKIGIGFAGKKVAVKYTPQK